MFGLCYRTEIGNDVDDEKGYRLHFIYGAAASPSDQNHDTVNESPDAVTRSWNFDTVPVKIKGYKPFSVLEISSLAADRNLIEQLETIVYGSDEDPSRLPMPDEIIDIFFPMYLYKMIELGYITAYIQNDHLYIQYADVAEVEEQYREIYGTFIFPRFENGDITADVDEYGHLIFIINDLDMIVPSVEEERLVITFE